MATNNGTGLLFVVTDLDPAQEAHVNRWYDQRHVPQRQALPGWISARRYVAVTGLRPAGAGQDASPVARPAAGC